MTYLETFQNEWEALPFPIHFQQYDATTATLKERVDQATSGIGDISLFVNFEPGERERPFIFFTETDTGFAVAFCEPETPHYSERHGRGLPWATVLSYASFIIEFAAKEGYTLDGAQTYANEQAYDLHFSK